MKCCEDQENRILVTKDKATAYDMYGNPIHEADAITTKCKVCGRHHYSLDVEELQIIQEPM